MVVALLERALGAAGCYALLGGGEVCGVHREALGGCRAQAGQMRVWRERCGREEAAAVMAEVKVVISEPRSRTRTRRNVMRRAMGRGWLGMHKPMGAMGLGGVQTRHSNNGHANMQHSLYAIRAKRRLSLPFVCVSVPRPEYLV